MLRRSLALVMLMAALMIICLPALAVEDDHQLAIDRAWLYLTDEQGISGEMLQQAQWQQLPVSLFGTEQEVELVVFSSAISSNLYSVYMNPDDGSLLMADEFFADGGLCLTRTLYLAPGLSLME